jgi:hypothetical protein
MTTVYERFYDMTPEGRAQAELDAANEAGNRLMDAYNALAADNAALRAELDALKAAGEWRPVTEKPGETAQYQVVMQHGQNRPVADHMAYYRLSGWSGTDVLYWRPIPPLPPTPDAADEVQP